MRFWIVIFVLTLKLGVWWHGIFIRQKNIIFRQDKKKYDEQPQQAGAEICTGQWTFSRDWSDCPVCCDVDIILLQFWYYRSGWQCNQWGLIWHFRIHCVYCAYCNISGGGFLVRQWGEPNCCAENDRRCRIVFNDRCSMRSDHEDCRFHGTVRYQAVIYELQHRQKRRRYSGRQYLLSVVTLSGDRRNSAGSAFVFIDQSDPGNRAILLKQYA